MKNVIYLGLFLLCILVYTAVVTGLLIRANKNLANCNENFYLLSEVWCVEQCSEWEKECGKICGACGVQAQGVGMKLCEEWLK